MKRSLILGIDPGSIVTGYGLVSLTNNALSSVDFGCIRPRDKRLSARYRYIFEALLELIDTHKPEAMVVEEQYVHKNVKSALKLSMAKGACLIAASLREIPIFEYAPTRAKRSVVGNGRASKGQVQAMIKHLLNLTHIPEPEDAADALSLAICHIHTIRTPTALKEI